MEKKLLWVVIGAIVLVGGYFLIKANNTKNAVDSYSFNNRQQAAMPQAQNNSKTASEIMQSGQPTKCSWSESANGNNVEYAAYINGQNARLESSIKSPYMSLSSAYLLADGYIYAWSSQTGNKGTKSKEVAPSANPGAPTPSASMTMAFHALLDGMNRAPGYSCQPWSVDATLLAPPANVTFMSVDR